MEFLSISTQYAFSLFLQRREKMLSEIEISRLRSRIDEVLRSGTPTDWQRQFLVDIREKFGRYGVRTRLSSKQLAILRRLTEVKEKDVGTAIADSDYRPAIGLPPARKTASPRSPFGRNPVRRNPFRIRNPLRLRNRLRLPYPFRALPFLGGGKTLALLAFLIVVGLVGGFLNSSTNTTESPSASPVAINSAPSSVPSKVNFTITDGDTIRLKDGTPVRLVGFNTPEKFEPQCSQEAALGNRASARLIELVATAKSTKLALVACACKPGTEGTKKCNYGRSCGTLMVDGRDVGQTLITEGLAVPFICGVYGCPPPPRPWCG